MILRRSHEKSKRSTKRSFEKSTEKLVKLKTENETVLRLRRQPSIQMKVGIVCTGMHGIQPVTATMRTRTSALTLLKPAPSLPFLFLPPPRGANRQPKYGCAPSAAGRAVPAAPLALEQPQGGVLKESRISNFRIS